jgi:hypothetical protein
VKSPKTTPPIGVRRVLTALVPVATRRRSSIQRSHAAPD